MSIVYWMGIMNQFLLSTRTIESSNLTNLSDYIEVIEMHAPNEDPTMYISLIGHSFMHDLWDDP